MHPCSMIPELNMSFAVLFTQTYPCGAGLWICWGFQDNKLMFRPIIVVTAVQLNKWSYQHHISHKRSNCTTCSRKLCTSWLYVCSISIYNMKWQIVYVQCVLEEHNMLSMYNIFCILHKWSCKLCLWYACSISGLVPLDWISLMCRVTRQQTDDRGFARFVLVIVIIIIF